MSILFRILLLFFVPIYFKKDYTDNGKIKNLIGNKLGEGYDKKCYEYKGESNKVIKIAKEPYELMTFCKNYNISFGNYRVYPLIIILLFNFRKNIYLKSIKRIHNLNDNDNFAKIYDFNSFYYIQEKMLDYGKINDKKIKEIKEKLRNENLYISDINYYNVMKNDSNSKIIDCEIYNSLEEYIRQKLFYYFGIGSWSMRNPDKAASQWG